MILLDGIVASTQMTQRVDLLCLSPSVDVGRRTVKLYDDGGSLRMDGEYLFAKKESICSEG